LHGVITRGDGLNIPLELVEVAMALKVVKHRQVDKNDEDTQASDYRSLILLLGKGFLRLLAGVAHENSRILIFALFWNRGRIYGIVNVRSCEFKEEEPFTLSIFFHIIQDQFPDV
jgi:hypothetical protein